MDIVLWIVAVLALLMAWSARGKLAGLQDVVDKAHFENSAKEADLAEMKQKLEVQQKLLERMAAGQEVDALMVREGRLYQNTNASDLQKSFESGSKPYVIDVRSPQEWATGHIPGAVHIPVDQLEKSLHQIKRDGTQMYLVCAGGGRSSTAAALLANRGYLNVWNVEGGMKSWRGEVSRD